MTVARPRFLRRLNQLLPPAWLGCLLALAGIGTPAPFATLARADAGLVVGRMLAQEAYLSLAMGVIILVLARGAARPAIAGDGASAAVGADESIFSTAMLLVLGTLFCTIVGYFVLQPMMAQARAGQSALSFGQLHAISGTLFALKVVLVAALAWRATRA